MAAYSSLYAQDRRLSRDTSLEQPAPEKQRISIAFEKTPVADALAQLASRSGLTLSWSPTDVPLSGEVTADIRNRTISEALSLVMQGSGGNAQVIANGKVIVVTSARVQARAHQEPATSVIGRIIDSATGKGLSGATITIVGTKLSSVSVTNGGFQIKGIARGTYQLSIRLLGYTTKTVPISIDSASVTVVIPLVTAATALAEVVTTATGQQRRVEVGNDITVIKADSIVKTMPVTNMSELLATRVPGLYAAPTSGEPGAPTRIRIRGVSSLNAGNDPVLIIDGVRAYGEQLRGNNAGTGLQQTSPLDQIDVNSIETVEVLKGPSAVATYGSDAANGVIVITTKRGREGPPQWSLSSTLGVTVMPGKWPVNYYRWGHSTIDATQLLQCTLSNEVFGSCQPDSVVSYQILNDRETTIFGTGLRQQYSGEIRGGTRGLTYALSGTILKDLGLVKLSNADRRMLETSGKLVPFWQRRPQQNETQSGTLNLGLTVGPMHNLSFTTSLHRGVNTGSPLRKAISVSQTLGPSTGSDVTGVLEEIPNFRTRETATVLRSRNALTLRSNLPWRVSTDVTAGVDVSLPTTRSFLATGDCFVVSSECPNTGVLNQSQGPTTVTSMDLRASKPMDGGRLISFKNTVGVNYTRTIITDFAVGASGLPPGAVSANDASYRLVHEMNSDRITAGAYIETVVGLANRVYVPFSIRKDAGSALGSSVAPLFPKLSFSYVASDEPWFRTIPTVGRLSTLRLRVGYGQAGKQPNVSDRMRTYIRRSTIWDETTQTYLDLSSIGNTRLKPERSKEFEGGFDTDFWDNRIALGVTWYQKYTTDLLVSEGVPPSVNGGGSQWVNLGDVHNTGFETTLGATVVDHRTVNWRLDVLFSQNRNALVKVGRKMSSVNELSTAQPVVGYPLNSFWAKTILGYSDFNEDGIIGNDEVLMSDHRVYVGSPDPKAVISVGNSITILGRLSFNARLKYDHSLTQWNERYGATCKGAGLQKGCTMRASNDKSVPLNVQAYALWSELARLQTVSVLRFNEMSLGYIFPHSVTRHVLRERTLRIAVQGTNLGLWTNYRGKDPSVNGGEGEGTVDTGVLPKNRLWQLSLTIN